MYLFSSWIIFSLVSRSRSRSGQCDGDSHRNEPTPNGPALAFRCLVFLQISNVWLCCEFYHLLIVMLGHLGSLLMRSCRKPKRSLSDVLSSSRQSYRKPKHNEVQLCCSYSGYGRPCCCSASPPPAPPSPQARPSRCPWWPSCR